MSHFVNTAIDESVIQNVTVIGSGPAGWSACIYSGRDLWNPLMITGDTIGGQLMLTTEIENYPGFAEPVSATDLMSAMRKQAERCGTTVIEDHVVEVDLQQRPFVLKTKSGKVIKSKVVIISTGAMAKRLGLKSEEKFQGYGVSGCATCDGFFFRGKVVGVVGGGNSAMEEAIYLTRFATKVFMIVRRDVLNGENSAKKEVMENDKIDIVWNCEVKEILGIEDDGNKFVNGVMLYDRVKDENRKIDLDGLFVAIGHAPNTALFKGQIDIDSTGYIKTKPDSTSTNIEGVYAAGDVQDPVYKQAVTSAATGCMAALEANDFLSRV